MKLVDINDGIRFLNEMLDNLDEETTPEEELELIKSALEAAEIQRDEKIVGVARWRKSLQAEAKEVIGGEIKRLRDRRSSYEKRVESLGEYLKFALNGGKVKTPIATVWEQKNSKPSVKIVDTEKIPAEFWAVKYTVKDGELANISPGEYRFDYVFGEIDVSAPDKDKIAKHWQETGEQVPGTITTQGTHIQMR